MISRIADINNGFLKYAAYRTYTEKTRLIILCVCGVLGFPMLGLAAVLKEAADNSSTYTPGLELFLGISVVLTVVACAVMAIIAYSGGIINFEYFNRREKVDMSWSLPVKTRDRFWGDFVSGIVPVAVIYSVSGLIGFAIVALGTRNSFATPEEYSVTMAMILTALIIGLLFLISLYIISVFCAALCGRVFEAAIYPALICGIIPSLIALVGIMVFNGAWLTQMGLTPSGLIQALPEPNGMLFKLCDENTEKYSDLVNETQARGGKLLRVCCMKGYSLATAGHHISAGGLKIGDTCIARYGYGMIRIRKLPPQMKVLTTKLANPKQRFICGNLLTSNGFVPDSLVAVASEPGKITFLLKEQVNENYSAIVKYARANKMNLIQVMDKKTGGVTIQIPLLSLQKAGLTTYEAYAAHFGYGVITLTKLDFEALGF